MHQHPSARRSASNYDRSRRTRQLSQSRASFAIGGNVAVGKRGAVYWMNFMVDGRRVQKSTRCRSKRDAEEVERAYRTRLAKGEVGFEEKKAVPSFKAAMKEYLVRFTADHGGKPNTRHRAHTSSKALIRFFGDIALDQITVEHVERFKDWRKKQKKLSNSPPPVTKQNGTSSRNITPEGQPWTSATSRTS